MRLLEAREGERSPNLLVPASLLAVIPNEHGDEFGKRLIGARSISLFDMAPPRWSFRRKGLLNWNATSVPEVNFTDDSTKVEKIGTCPTALGTALDLAGLDPHSG
jgi:hypothetical protein